MLKDRWISRGGASELRRRLLDLVLPTTCLHCESALEGKEHVFCRTCAELLELFQEHLPTRSPLHSMTCAFAHTGPAARLVRALRKRPQLATGAAGYLAAQLLRKGWPLPDLITWVPLTRIGMLLHGFNPAALLARSLAQLLSCETMSTLRYQRPRLPQRLLSEKERRALPNDTFRYKSKRNLGGKTILLVDDLCHTGATLHACAHALTQALPSRLYGITLTGQHG